MRPDSIESESTVAQDDKGQIDKAIDALRCNKAAGINNIPYKLRTYQRLGWRRKNSVQWPLQGDSWWRKVARRLWYERIDTFRKEEKCGEGWGAQNHQPYPTCVNSLIQDSSRPDWGEGKNWIGDDLRGGSIWDAVLEKNDENIMARDGDVLIRAGETRKLVETITTRKRRWVGHVMRHESLLRDSWEGGMEGRRPRGRKRVQMLDDVEEGRQYRKVKAEAQVWEEWRHHWILSFRDLPLAEYRNTHTEITQ